MSKTIDALALKREKTKIHKHIATWYSASSVNIVYVMKWLCTFYCLTSRYGRVLHSDTHKTNLFILRCVRARELLILCLIPSVYIPVLKAEQTCTAGTENCVSGASCVSHACTCGAAYTKETDKTCSKDGWYCSCTLFSLSYQTRMLVCVYAVVARKYNPN